MTTRTRTAPFGCPSCGERVTLLIPVRQSADEFCPKCDFPLFWAENIPSIPLTPLVPPTDPTKPPPDDPSPPDSVPPPPTIRCPHCGQLDPADAVFCLHCGSRIRATSPAWLPVFNVVAATLAGLALIALAIVLAMS